MRPCLADIDFAASFHNESRLSLADKSLQQGPSDLKLFFQSVVNATVALVAVDGPLEDDVDDEDAVKRKMSDLTFDETFRPLEESMNLCTPSVHHQTTKIGSDWKKDKVGFSGVENIYIDCLRIVRLPLLLC